ncbi:MAG TPA: glycosyltransferase family 4 protein [Mycobacteriales bacterium]|nr:glycosyltransferase family 4 protein [Mycobacteriales bacterium]
MTASAPRRLLMTADTVGGVWTYALELVTALAAYDVEVHLATMGRPLDAHQRRAVAGTPVAGVHESTFALEWMADPWSEVDAAGEWLLDLEAQLRPEVVHLNGYAHAALPWHAPTVVVAHSCVLSWWQAVHGVDAPAEWDSYRRRVTEGLFAATAVVAPTQAMLAALSRCYGYGGGTVVLNGRTAPPDATGADKEQLIVGTGRVWDEAKNLRRLAADAPRLPWPVVIAGDPHPPGVVARGAPARAPDASHVPEPAASLVGVLPAAELSALLSRAAVYVAPARYEPFGLGVLEAAQAGCALVLGDIPSLRELWGDAACYVDPASSDELVATVQTLVQCPERLQSAGRAARSRATAYTPERMAAGYLEVYQALPRAPLSTAGAAAGGPA